MLIRCGAAGAILKLLYIIFCLCCWCAAGAALTVCGAACFASSCKHQVRLCGVRRCWCLQLPAKRRAGAWRCWCCCYGCKSFTWRCGTVKRTVTVLLRCIATNTWHKGCRLYCCGTACNTVARCKVPLYGTSTCAPYFKLRAVPICIMCIPLLVLGWFALLLFVGSCKHQVRRCWRLAVLVLAATSKLFYICCWYCYSAVQVLACTVRCLVCYITALLLLGCCSFAVPGKPSKLIVLGCW